MIGKDDITAFYFIRHGPIVKKDGHLPPYDAPLIDQEFNLDALVKTLPHHADWHISPLQRAQQTANLLTGHLAPASQVIEPALAEQHFGDWHDQPIATIWQQLATLPKHNWSFITHDICPPHGESFDQQMLRVASWCDLQERKRFTTAQIMVAHIGTIRAVLAHILKLPAEVAQAIEIPYFGGLHASLMAKDHAAQNQGGAWQIHQLGKITSPAA
ncbi:MAG: histidine phosphatase family protein [Alphaproteobacteria bacterium]|jgi:alpha-ribazole phosphatase|nr:histidine phosphatase family protein [Alphaproteobacteria bacterium]